MQIVQKSIHLIDYNNNQVIFRETPDTFDEFVNELISHIRDNESVREYKTRSNSNEVIASILTICSRLEDPETIQMKIEGIARRLLLKESEAQERISRTNTNVQKGSLVQALLWDENSSKFVYLLAKVQHTEWVDDADFLFKTGFSKDKKSIWKSCLIDIPDVTDNEFHAKIYSDTVARYWWSEFLEFNEMNSDESNTFKAFKAIATTLNIKFRGRSSPDHIILHNAFINHLKTTEQVDYVEMVNSVLSDNYQPADPDFTTPEKIQDIKTTLLEQPRIKNFDRQFIAVNSAINARIRKVYPLTDEISLKIHGSITNIRETIQSIEEDGVRYIRVKVTKDETYDRFRTDLPAVRQDSADL